MAFSSIDSGMSRPSSGIISPPNKSRSRTQSISSDRPSTLAGHSLMSPPLTVSPEAAFIAASAASQIVTNDHDGHADAWYDQHGVEPSGETALVSPAALQLVNNFLDQLLFNFLSVSRSTTLTSLRPAVSEVLKPKLAKDAINQADEELREYLGGGDDEELLQQPTETPRDWDLELVWKRTRLRCMVYSSLGDMEEEDEDYYMEQEHLDAGEERLSETVSPAVAIFLTSILEFMGEQALVVAGQAAYHRMRSKYEKDLKEGARSPADIADRICVEELDMERVALDRTLGRLWRAWKKRIRSPIAETHSFSRPFSRGSERHFRQSSFGTDSHVAVPEIAAVPAKARSRSRSAGASKEASAKEAELYEEEEYLRAAAIPLPLGDRDIAEILIPGLAYYSDEEDEDEVAEEETTAKEKPQRPVSLMIMPHSAAAAMPPTPNTSQPQTPLLPPPRKRANSLPTPSTSPFYSSPSKRVKVEDEKAPEQAVEAGDEAEEVDETETEEDPNREKRARISALIAGASAVGATAVAGVAAAVKGKAAGSKAVDSDGEGEELDEFNEEPEIMTSSRVSISGRSSSPTTSDHGRPLSIQPGMPTRSSSVHSIRVIDMAGPRSPITRSRGSSVEAQEQTHSRAAQIARRGSSGSLSTSTPPIAEERRQPEGLRAAPAIKAARTHAGESISEAEEMAEQSATPTTESLSTPTSEPRSATRFEDLAARMQSGTVMFGSVPRHGSPPQSPGDQSPVQPATKVTILSSTHSSGYYEDAPNVPPKSPRAAKPASPTPPDRTSSRQHSPTTSKPSSIGVISVDRPPTRNLKEAPEPLRTSPARSREQPAARPTHTSGSSVSSSQKYKPIRASEDSISRRPEDVARNFEELIQSDQTIQYTLTPEGMRDLDVSPLRAYAAGHSTPTDMLQGETIKTRRSNDQSGDRMRPGSASVNTGADLRRSISISRKTGLSSHPVESQSPPGLPSKPRGPPAQAREARVPRESLADFADFIRATGPTEEMSGARPPAVGAMRTASGPVPIAKASIDSARPSNISSRSRFQARDATVDYKDDNSDLIDFIRRGPPSASNPRIPRNVAPFRSTMDSDQMAGTVGGKAVDARLPDLRYSGTSTNVTESSMNSSSALLKKDRGSPKFGDEADMMPKRKTRRVKDPYALDFSDEENEEYDSKPPARSMGMGMSKRAEPKEESLADFLNSVAPPPDSAPVPFNIPQTRNAMMQPKKKASAPSLITRFAQRVSPTQASYNFGGNGSNSSPLSTGGATRPTMASRTSTGGKGYIPIQVNMPPGVDKYSPQAASSSGGGGSMAPPPVPKNKVLMKKFEPREAQAVGRSATSDLADFLRNSGPPGGGGFAGRA
jgi:hypothetical protein